MLNRYQNFIFDLDGTIINSSSQILNCLKISYKDANYFVDDSKFTSDVIGPPIRTIISTITPELSNEDKILEIISNFRKNYDYSTNDVSIMYEGMFGFLFDLKKRKKKLFIATFKPKIPTFRILEKFGITDLFEDIYTVDKYSQPMTKKAMLTDIITQYCLEKNITAMIGDDSSDMVAAKENNINGIGVLWGYGKDKTKLISNSTYTIKNVKEFKCLK